jgi:hypothetical protein
MALSNGDLFTPGAWPVAADAAVRFVAVPTQVRPCFAVPLVSFHAGANTLYLQDVDPHDRIAGFNAVDLRAEELTPLFPEVSGLDYGCRAVHAVLTPDGQPLAGTREELKPSLAQWVGEITWPVTRLAFADFMDDDMAIMSAADAALRQMVSAEGDRAAAAWFGNAVVFRRLQRGALMAATTPARRLELERGLEQVRIEVCDGELVAHLPDILMDIFDGANARALPGLSMASRLAALVSPSGLSLVRMAPSLSEEQHGSPKLAPAARSTSYAAENAAARSVPEVAGQSDDAVPTNRQAARTLRDLAVERLSAKLNVELNRVRGSLYESQDGTVRAMISTSRRHHQSYKSYWYGFYDSQRQYLGRDPASYLVLGALDSGRLWAVPVPEIGPLIDEMTTTTRPNGQVYRHILSKLEGERCILRTVAKDFDLSPFEL